MKIQFYFFTVLLSIVLFSCQEDELYFENAFDKSYKEWLNFKKVTGNSYRYTVIGSTWVGASWETTVTVTEGEVTARSFKMTASEELLAEIPEEDLEWAESGDKINSHTDTPAAETITLDEIYEKARTEWLTKKDDVKAFFETDNDGMISTCGYVENNCADDCFTGINISGIEQL
ncbi:hypothetical protein [Maribellus maritimus]|uniref:hypothetical protein n=1 Tax=Maribellus maritimus TaxID=2870838 RepID=UPI001EE9E8B7|nr:hypothetical protein [Maribellus maritimus]MCG6187176.1 hypothetical protein [Maribellus maritimus]